MNSVSLAGQLASQIAWRLCSRRRRVAVWVGERARGGGVEHKKELSFPILGRLLHQVCDTVRVISRHSVSAVG
jgi:hypothetical protein